MVTSKQVGKNLIEAERLLTEAMGDEEIDDRLFGQLADMVRKLRILLPEKEHTRDDAEARARVGYDAVTCVHTLGEVPRVS